MAMKNVANVPEQLARRLNRLVTDSEQQLLKVSEEDVDMPLRAGGWNRKEELGHLLDSAVNNHQRFVVATLEGKFRGPKYDQDGWVALHQYADAPWNSLVKFWTGYNRRIAELMDLIPSEKYGAICEIGDNEPVTLEFLMEDYIRHAEHHLQKILG